VDDKDTCKALFLIGMSKVRKPMVESRLAAAETIYPMCSIK